MVDLLGTAAKVLVVGAGGLGCEILKNLCLTGIRQIHVIDLDTIDLSNLNRQFLFREKDIGKYKAEVATEYIKARYPGVSIEWSCCKVQELKNTFFRDFHVIIGGLDNVEARLFLNNKVHDLVEFDPETGEMDEDSKIIYIDGGTEGFRGQSRVVTPFNAGCYECTIGVNTDRVLR